MMRVTGAGGINANLAPDAFHRWATHYYKCKQDFQPPHRFSPVPYFLLCRAIELQLKSKHLQLKTQDQVKQEYWHNLSKLYGSLSDNDKVLNASELNILEQASNIYAPKDFEYFTPEDALTAYSRYPDMQALDAVARKLIGI